MTNYPLTAPQAPTLPISGEAPVPSSFSFPHPYLGLLSGGPLADSICFSDNKLSGFQVRQGAQGRVGWGGQAVRLSGKSVRGALCESVESRGGQWGKVGVGWGA